MALFPVFIVRSQMVEKSTKGFDFVSTTFIAKFADGSEKLLNRKDKLVKGLQRECDLGEVGMSKDECPLYFRDWSNNPVLGKFGLNYPAAVD